MAKEVEYNYMAVKDENGETIGIFAMEIGSGNERIIVEKAVEHKVSIHKSTKEEYEDFDEEEVIIIE